VNGQILTALGIHRLDKRVEGMYFLWGLLGPRSIAFKKGGDAKERRRLLHNVSENGSAGVYLCCGGELRTGWPWRAALHQAVHQ
jgi:hypothetical protein